MSPEPVAVPRGPAVPDWAGDDLAPPAAAWMPALDRRPRRLWPLWTALVAVVVLLTCGLPAALLSSAVRDAGVGVVRRVSPQVEDPTVLAARQLSARLTAQLERQAAALLAGDRAGWLAVAEPAAHPELLRRYAALRALRVTGWQVRAQDLPTEVPGRPGEWRLLVEYRYCFVVPGCRVSSVVAGTRWRLDGGQPRLVAVEASRSARTGTRPWEISELVVAHGSRTVVATTPELRRTLPELLAKAEAAARVADDYVVSGPPPDRYRVFYAGPQEWRRWYGGDRMEWTAGYAVTVGGGHHEVVLNAERVSADGLADLLRHELTHAASLPERGYPGRSTWWLVEGLAEYAAADGQPVDRYEGLTAVRQMVRAGWTGRLDDVAPGEDATAERVAGSYGVSYLAVRHLIDRYGPGRVLAFTRLVLHELRPVAEAAQESLGEAWPGVHDRATAYVRAVVG
ncbi:Peptidase MA superfamily [Micromonospora nigra]|uniref:Peptidase MA superfamily n=1 Tax=Micromonospora nigra TaxID=145857 RepID=A0A1C6RTD6_9ACTN|nr:Peptidase MA superfamily [Micromonospora nigra]